MRLAESDSQRNNAKLCGQTASTEARPLHRIRSAREQQGISIRTAARRLNVVVEQAREEEESSDMLLTTLYRWQQALEVPVSQLLVDLDSCLSSSVQKRARLLRLMKTAGAIVENAKTPPLKRLAKRVISQLVEIMPELKEVSPWHSVGQRRTRNEVGRIAEQTIPDALFFEHGRV